MPLSFGLSGAGWSPSQGHCVVFLGKTFFLAEPLFTEAYKWVAMKLMLGGNPVMDRHPIQGVEKLQVAETGDICWPDRPLGLYAD